jgi:5-methylthioadenosine/S-adenosylhomocysteine deaminase
MFQLLTFGRGYVSRETIMNAMIYQADYILTMDKDNSIIKDGAVLVKQGKITHIDSATDLKQRFPNIPITTLSKKLLMPGLINTHCHSGMLRGTAEGLPVWDWLQQYIDPMHRVLSPLDASISSWLCYAEALLSGTTCIVDMWRYMDGSADAAKHLGIRACLVPYVAEHPDHNYFETLDSNEALINKWHQGADGRLQVWVGLEHLFYAVPKALKRIEKLCQDYQVGFHTHSNESRFDVDQTLQRFQVRPVQALQKFGLLKAPKVLLAHCVWVDESEIALMAEYKIGVAHNPISNMKLASGAAPVLAMLKAGLAVGLGTDGEKENNNLDMFEEMKTSSLLAKFSNLDAAALDAWEICRMATINGAKALALDSEIGSLEVGKSADMIALRIDTPRMTPLIDQGPLLNIHQNVVHAVQGQDVDMTMVAGKILVQNGSLVNHDMQQLIAAVNLAAPALFARREQWLKNSGGGKNALY